MPSFGGFGKSRVASIGKLSFGITLGRTAFIFDQGYQTLVDDWIEVIQNVKRELKSNSQDWDITYHYTGDTVCAPSNSLLQPFIGVMGNGAPIPTKIVVVATGYERDEDNYDQLLLKRMKGTIASIDIIHIGNLPGEYPLELMRIFSPHLHCTYRRCTSHEQLLPMIMNYRTRDHWFSRISKQPTGIADNRPTFYINEIQPITNWILDVTYPEENNTNDNQSIDWMLPIDLFLHVREEVYSMMNRETELSKKMLTGMSDEITELLSSKIIPPVIKPAVSKMVEDWYLPCLRKASADIENGIEWRVCIEDLLQMACDLPDEYRKLISFSSKLLVIRSKEYTDIPSTKSTGDTENLDPPVYDLTTGEIVPLSKSLHRESDLVLLLDLVDDEIWTPTQDVIQTLFPMRIESLMSLSWDLADDIRPCIIRYIKLNLMLLTSKVKELEPMQQVAVLKQMLALDIIPFDGYIDMRSNTIITYHLKSTGKFELNSIIDFIIEESIHRRFNAIEDSEWDKIHLSDMYIDELFEEMKFITDGMDPNDVVPGYPKSLIRKLLPREIFVSPTDLRISVAKLISMKEGRMVRKAHRELDNLLIERIVTGAEPNQLLTLDFGILMYRNPLPIKVVHKVMIDRFVARITSQLPKPILSILLFILPGEIPMSTRVRRNLWRRCNKVYDVSELALLFGEESLDWLAKEK